MLVSLVLPMTVLSAAAVHSQTGQYSFVSVERDRDYPVRGMTSKTVLLNYGEPVNRKNPVGNPPISYWTYEGFTVYFENQLVITTVAAKDRLPSRLQSIQ